MLKQYFIQDDLEYLLDGDAPEPVSKKEIEKARRTAKYVLKYGKYPMQLTKKEENTLLKVKSLLNHLRYFIKESAIIE